MSSINTMLKKLRKKFTADAGKTPEEAKTGVTQPWRLDVGVHPPALPFKVGAGGSPAREGQPYLPPGKCKRMRERKSILHGARGAAGN
ncbi:unnamed protein product, partial [Iphiclides podalirius]